MTAVFLPNWVSVRTANVDVLPKSQSVTATQEECAVECHWAIVLKSEVIDKIGKRLLGWRLDLMLVTLMNGISCKVQQALGRLQKQQGFISFEFSASLISGVPWRTRSILDGQGFVYGSKLLEDLSLFFYCLGANTVTYTALCKRLCSQMFHANWKRVRGFSGVQWSRLSASNARYQLKVWLEN